MFYIGFSIHDHVNQNGAHQRQTKRQQQQQQKEQAWKQEN